MSRDFNNIGPWLNRLLNERQLSVERLARKSGLSRAAVYFYMQDKNRPSEEAMMRMCTVLGVPFEEGLKQYTPNANGRPTRSGGTRVVTIRGRS